MRLFWKNKKTLAHYHLNHYTQINFFLGSGRIKFLQGFCRIASFRKLITSIFKKQKKFLLNYSSESPPLTRGKGYSVPWPLLKGYPVTYYKHVKFTINGIFCRLLTCRQLADHVIISLRTSDTSHRSGPWEPLDLDTPLKENAYHVGVVFFARDINAHCKLRFL